MWAVIKTGGKQYLVSPADKIKIEKLEAEEGQEIIFDQVLLLVSDKGAVKIGTPLIKEAKVKAKVLKQGRAEKVIIFKYRPKKREQKKKGHRQPYTEVVILSVSEGSRERNK